MAKRVYATLLVALVAGLSLYFFASGTAPVITQPEPSAAEPAQVVAQPAPATADMSLPMPMGLKGDPAKGGAFFMTNCFTCHGVKGDGEGPRAYFISPPPRNFLLESSRQRLNRPVLFEAIAKGRLGTNMPAWSGVLNNQEIADVAEFVFQNFISAPPGSTSQVK